MTGQAIVVGGGIGGLAAAAALRRIGWQAVVLERAAELRERRVQAGAAEAVEAPANDPAIRIASSIIGRT